MKADHPCPGLVIHQPERGFRYGAEAFWVAGFALEGGIPATALDLGTGSGIIAGLLASRGVPALGVDVRPEWLPYWQATLLQSTVPLRLEQRDVREVEGKFSLAISNPPFFPKESGPASSDPWKAAARTEGSATLADFVVAGLRVADRLCLVIPRNREAEAVVAAGRPASRVVRAGEQRSLLEFSDAPAVETVHLDEVHPRTMSWYASLGAKNSASNGR